MSIQAVSWVLDQNDIPARAKLALVAIANHASHVDGYCWLKAETIAMEAACTPRSVYTFIGALVRNGFIRKEPRRGEDGKQRANDYWIIFDREEKGWDWGGHPDQDVAECDSTDDGSSEAEGTISCWPTEVNSHGENPVPPEAHDTRQPVEMSVPSHGPTEGVFTRKRIAEPSKTKPKEIRARESAPSGPPRGYRPPPPQPLGAVVEQTKQIFVYEGSRAWDAWVTYKKRTTGHAWSLSRTSFVDGKHRSGWWFPSLFPPDQPAAPKGLSESEAKEFSDTG